MFVWETSKCLGGQNVKRAKRRREKPRVKLPVFLIHRRDKSK